MSSTPSESGGTADRNGNGQFAVGNTVTREGSPNKAAWIKEQLFARCTTEMLDELANGDRKLFWDVLCRIMPKQIQAEVGGVGSIAEECTAALKRAGIGSSGRTRLGEVARGAEVSDE